MEHMRTVWDAAALILEEARGLRGISERELVDRALEFANTGSLESVKALRGGFGSAKSVSTFGTRSGSDDVASREREDLPNARMEFQTYLEGVIGKNVNDLEHLDVALRAFLAANAGQMVLIPKRIPRGGRPFRTYAILPRGLRAALAYVLQLCLDDTQSYGERLCKCRLTGCPLFFFARLPERGTGRRRRRYCCDAHMKEAHDKGAADRRRKKKAKEMEQLQARKRGVQHVTRSSAKRLS
jgi:hypothetical protein